MILWDAPMLLKQNAWDEYYVYLAFIEIIAHGTEKSRVTYCELFYIHRALKRIGRKINVWEA